MKKPAFKVLARFYTNQTVLPQQPARSFEILDLRSRGKVLTMYNVSMKQKRSQSSVTGF